MMQAVTGWVAPVATAAAAVMTASNLGPRMTGWGFVVFFVGSVCWCLVALQTDQNNLLWTNGFLTLVNLAGVWRWLGRQTRYERASANASAASQKSETPDLLPLGALIGARVRGRDDQPVGQVVEAMLRRDRAALAYVVVSTGGIGGLGETLHALAADKLTLTDNGVSCDLTEEDMDGRSALSQDLWPTNAAEEI